MNPKSHRRARRAPTRKIRYAVVGLGHIAQTAVLPAFQNARSNSELVALVSDDPVKLKKLGRKYGAAIRVSYEGYDALLTSGEIDAVYIALPNHLHHPYTLRAAAAGIHVLCEKPMALDEAECEDMIRACDKYDVRLMIAYRLHLEAANLRAIELVRKGSIGHAHDIVSTFAIRVEPPNVRFEAEFGGGALYDIGIYCINAARYLFRAEPIEVVALTSQPDKKRFAEVDETTSGILRFPGDRLATFSASFAGGDTNAYQVLGDLGSLELTNAYGIGGEKTLTVSRGKASRTRTFRPRDQFGAELVYFSNCIRGRKRPEPDGREGLADVRVIRALLESARKQSTVKLDPFTKSRRPTTGQEIERPAVPEPELVHAGSPKKD